MTQMAEMSHGSHCLVLSQLLVPGVYKSCNVYEIRRIKESSRRFMFSRHFRVLSNKAKVL